MRTPKLALVIVLAAAAGLNCSDSKGGGADGGGRDGSGTGGTGGTSTTGGTGGTTATGGTAGTSATGGTAGTSATGGTAGTSATGGTAGTSATGGTGGTAGTGATGGTGGTSATGGTGGTSATGGTGGASANCEIPCLTNLVMGCVPDGTCMSQTTLTPAPSINQCYSNGVKLSTAISIGGGGGGAVVVTYSKAGATCYSIEGMQGAGMNFTFSYKNPGGTVVATGTYDNAMMKTTIMCSGSSMVYDLSSPACANVPRGQMGGMGTGGAGGNQCPMGACP